MIEPVVARRIRLVAFDVDGVLTDGGLYIGNQSASRVELKRFHSQDGLGIWFLRNAGLRVALVSGRLSEATALRARELQIDDLIQDETGLGNKLAPFEALIGKHGVRFDECAFVGDDIPDLPLLRRVGLPAAVANAVADVKDVSNYVTRAIGGHGAVREFTEALLTARGAWSKTVQAYLRERGDVARR